MPAAVTIQLADGTMIERCLQKTEDYCRPISADGIAAFELYDQVDVRGDDELTVCDLWLANGIAAGIQQKHVADLWQRKALIDQLLTPIPRQVGLESDDLDPGLFADLENLLEAWMSVRGWGCARVTKVLHKKRPLLIPPIDSRMMDLYSRLRRARGNRRWMYYPSEAGDVVGVIKQIRDDIRNEDNRPTLQYIQERLERNGIRLSIVRIFDIVLWTHLTPEYR